MFFKNTNVIESYDALVQQQQELKIKMSNLGRKKDYMVQRIEKKFNSKIENLIRQQKAIDLKMSIAKEYVNDTKCENI